MKSRIAIIDKSNTKNKKCGYCKYYLSINQTCTNPKSVDYSTQRFDYNRCKSFKWHDNVIDKNVIRTCEFCKGINIDRNRAIPICLKLAEINKINEDDYKKFWYLIICNENECLIK